MQAVIVNDMVTDQPGDVSVVGGTENYADVLQYHGVSFRQVDFYLQVGDINQVQGWLLYISVVRSQVVPFLNAVLPALLETGVTFRIVQDKSTARMILDGSAGMAMVGKVMTIYPRSDEEAVKIAQMMIPLTVSFDGPAVQGGIHVGGNIYTRYGGFNPVRVMDASGRAADFIYDMEGKLTRDNQMNPFSLLPGLTWPFESLKAFKVPTEKKTLRQIYRLVALLKTDAKGNVYRGVYLKKWFLVRPCVIKQGKGCMWSDDAGMDMHDRLAWQQVIHNELAGYVPMPNIFDQFIEDGDSYLVMDFIKGIPLHYQIAQNNPDCKSWRQYTSAHKIRILDYILRIIDIIDRLHKRGYVHRDITPVNFLVDKGDSLFLIDNEMAYSLHKQYPNPPFQFGTVGFMSPEQMESQTPTVKEDIFGLGATIVSMITGLSPLVFENQQYNKVRDSLIFFIGDKQLSETIIACLNHNPLVRPNLHFVKDVIQKAKGQIRERGKIETTNLPDENQIRAVIAGAIRSLNEYPTPIVDGIWKTRVSQQDNEPGMEQAVFTTEYGLAKGLAGVLYLLGKARKMGFEIQPCLQSYYKSWAFLNENCLNRLSEMPPGFYGGAAGIAVAIATGIDAGSLEDTPDLRSVIQQCFEIPSTGLDMTSGVAGQGIAALQCSTYIERNVLDHLLGEYAAHLISNRQKNNCWVQLQTQSGKRSYAGSFSFGNTGIIWFLLKYGHSTDNKEAYNVAIQSIDELIKYATVTKRNIKKFGLRKVIEAPGVYDSIYGCVLVLILAYEVTKNPRYKMIAEGILLLFPKRILHDNFYQDTGLAGLGEVYLEAFRVFRNEIWKERADWIAGVFLHNSSLEPDGRCYWVNNNATYPIAEFMTGNTGIIHFLIRWLHTEKLCFRLLL